jgi:biopolymer transport protein ExbD
LPETLNLMVNSKGQVLLDGVASEEPQIRARLHKATEAGKKPQVVIAADRTVDYGRVIQLIDLVKAHGIDNFALEVERG